MARAQGPVAVLGIGAMGLAGMREFEAAGFTHVALVQVGGDYQGAFLDWSEDCLLPALSHL